jgi:hypothetical protein
LTDNAFSGFRKRILGKMFLLFAEELPSITRYYRKGGGKDKGDGKTKKNTLAATG